MTTITIDWRLLCTAVFFIALSILVEVIVDRALGVTPRLKDLPSWRVRVHESMYWFLGAMFYGLFVK